MAGRCNNDTHPKRVLISFTGCHINSKLSISSTTYNSVGWIRLCVMLGVTKFFYCFNLPAVHCQTPWSSSSNRQMTTSMGASASILPLLSKIFCRSQPPWSLSIFLRLNLGKTSKILSEKTASRLKNLFQTILSYLMMERSNI